MNEFLEEQEMIQTYGAVKIQSIARMIIVRARLLRQLNDRYEKIYDPRRERYYYYDKVKDKSSWGKPLLLLKSDINIISPTYIESNGQESSQVDAESITTLDSGNLDKETVDSDDEDESGSEKDGTAADGSEPNESDFDSDDSEAVRERRRQRRKYPRSKAQLRVDQGEDDLHNTTHLDLSGLGATRLTSRIYDLIELKELNISDNKLNRISPNIQYLASLQKLDAHGNCLPTLPKELEELQELTSLDVSRNSISDYPGRIYRLGKLEELNLSHNPFKIIPVEIGNLELLAELGQWEIGIGFLSRLMRLDVSHCALTVWPPYIGTLMELHYLDLSYNQLQEVPSDVADNQALRTLLLAGNGIDKLAPDIYALANLEVLDLSHNQLKALPDVPPSNLASDPAVRTMDRLRDLNISYNQISILDDLLGIFCNVETFDASHNQIIAFHGECISTLTSLSVLDISHNLLEMFPLGLRGCVNLSHFKAAYNKLTFVPETFVSTTKLITIDLSHNEITDAAGKVFAMLSHLKVLLLNYNQIGPLPAMLFTVRNLEHLDLSHNEIPIIAEALGQLTSVTYLDLSYNQIASIPETISALTRLSTLLLESNRLTYLPHGIGKLHRRLSRISVNKNDFTQSPSLLSALPLLVSSNLSWNPRLQGHWVDWVKATAEFKPKKAFIPPQILQRRVHQVVERLDTVIRTASPAVLPDSLYRTPEEETAAAAAAERGEEDDELAEFQNAIVDDDPAVVSAGVASVKSAKKARSKALKKLRQVLDWHDLLRERILTTAFRDPSDEAPGGRPRTASTVASAAEAPSAQSQIAVTVMPTAGDVRTAQSSRLQSHTYSLFKMIDKHRGGTAIGLGWQEALTVAEEDILADKPCAAVLATLPMGSELQDSLEALQYLINECDALLMVSELRHMLEGYARRMQQLRVLQKQEEAAQNIAPGVKAKLGALSSSAKKAVQRNQSGKSLRGLKWGSSKASNPEPAESIPETQESAPDTMPQLVLEGVEGGEGLLTEDIVPGEGAAVQSADVPRDGAPGEVPDSAAPAVAAEEGAAPDRNDQEVSAGVSALTITQPTNLTAASADATTTVVESLGFASESTKVPSVQPGASVKASHKLSSMIAEAKPKALTAQEVAASNVNSLALNVKVQMKAKRVDNALAEEAAKLNKLIATTIDQLQKPALAIDFTTLPFLAFSAIAAEGIYPGVDGSITERAQPVLMQLIECCLHLTKTLLLRCDALRDAIRILEVRGSLPASCLDVAQRRGEDFVDHMSDLYEELSARIAVRETEAGGGGSKSKSIFGKKNESSALLATAMLGASAEDSEADEEGGGNDATINSSAAPAPLTRTNTASSAGAPAAPTAKKVLLSTMLPPVNPNRQLRHPVDTATARKCIRHLVAHRVLTLMWVTTITDMIAGILKRRGVDPIYPLYRTHTKHEFNFTPEWATRSAARLAQFRGMVYQGLCVYYKSIEEYTSCIRFSPSARSLPYYLNVIKLHIAQGSFLLARNSLHDCLRLHFATAFPPSFDLTDVTAMPEPLDILPVNKELALLQALIDANLKHINDAGVFTAPYNKFLCVQENGLMSGTNRVPIECERGLTPYKVALIKAREARVAGASAALQEAQELEQAREDVKQRIAAARAKAQAALSAE